MASALSPIGRERVKDLALDQIKRYIASGAVAAGQRLPSERELARQLGVGRNSVREALKILEAMGIVEARIGEGTFITAQPGAGLDEVPRLNLAAWGGTVLEILQARSMLEVEVARVAAKRAGPEDLAALSLELARMEAVVASADASGADVHEYIAADMNFHRTVAKATRNSVVAGMIANLLDTLEELLHQTHGERLPVASEGMATHRDICTAIEQRDPDAAAAAIRLHLQFSVELWSTLKWLGGAGTLHAAGAVPAADHPP